MKIIRNNIIPFKGFAAINICGVLFVRKDVIITDKMIRHETIHTEQMKELLIVPFYLVYLVEWIIKLFVHGKQSYRNISFEREACENEQDTTYLNNRKRWAFVRYIIKKK